MAGKSNYFQAFENHFWQWEEQGDVVAVRGGSTIAYRAFLQEIISVFATAKQGLPPFGALLLAIMATGSNAQQLLNELDSRITLDDPFIDEYANAKKFLAQLSSVPPEFKTGSKKVQLFLAIFEKCHGIGSTKRLSQIIDTINGGNTLENCLIPVAYSQPVVQKDIRVFSTLSSKLTTVDQILERVAALPDITGLFELPEPPVEEGKSAPSDFIEELMANDKTHAVGSLIRHLWGGLNIPVHSSLPSSQPLGGISDLTNKGDFDKLLVSEFANDDLVFLSRLANNEALYIQREIPPQQNNVERIILIDCSLKNWGTPKTVAFAIMLAISKHPKTDIPCRSFVIGETYRQVDTGSVASLVDALSELDIQLNPVNGLIAYLKDFPPQKRDEIFVIAERSVVKQPAMLKAANDLHNAIAYWIYTDEVGKIDVYKKQQNSTRLVQHIQLPLKELWKKKEASAKRTHRGAFRGDYPILFFPPANHEYLPGLDLNSCYIASRDGPLFRVFEEFSNRQHKFNNSKGIEFVWDKLPRFSQYEIGRDSNGDPVLASVNIVDNQIVLFNIKTRKESTAFFDRNGVSKGELHFDGTNFRYSSRAGNWVIQPDDATVKNSPQGHYGNIAIMEAKKKVLAKVPQFSSNRSVLKKVSSVSINKQQNLVFNNHELRFNGQSDSVKISVRKEQDTVIESICTDTNEFTFNDGSSVEVNPSGMLILKSSKPSVPMIFIPSVLETKLGVATKNSFCGDPFFKNTDLVSISTTEFFENFMKPFIQHILSHGA